MNKISSIQVSHDSLATLLSNYCNTCGNHDCTMRLFDYNEFECPFKDKDCISISKQNWKVILRYYLEGEISLRFNK